MDDLVAWAFTSNGNFSLWTAYNAAKGLNVLNPTTSSLSWIWKLKVPPKFILFIWICSNNSIPIKEVLGSRGLSLDQRCSICNSHIESISHMLKECPTQSASRINLVILQGYTPPLASLSQIGCMSTAPLYWSLSTMAFHGPLCFSLAFGLYGLTGIVSLTKKNIQNSNY